jgi:hypothetical protein
MFGPLLLDIVTTLAHFNLVLHLPQNLIPSALEVFLWQITKDPTARITEYQARTLEDEGELLSRHQATERRRGVAAGMHMPGAPDSARQESGAVCSDARSR